MFGTAGSLAEFRAALFASRGFVAYALPYFAHEDLPSVLYDLQFEYFMVYHFGLVARKPLDKSADQHLYPCSLISAMVILSGKYNKKNCGMPNFNILAILCS